MGNHFIKIVCSAYTASLSKIVGVQRRNMTKVDKLTIVALLFLALAATLSNGTRLENNDVENSRSGICMCDKIYLPVCGTNGKEYVNPCEAACSNVEVACMARCPC